ncbi:hypothetical protein GO002_01720 [Streptomyces eurocidicus]|uniref:Uncharacterized protein n=2 Tax=Streptomyces eurocidicus TaxID=66423 RepID=A0A7W8BDR8_STREU|nr:hypothetical protein [Streptomyces eurocidicus]MBB5119594.1 hypothetical protein [Streptomyces eurocidicus]MBF6050629.1 hypothetical protein [Streptomyces eurocidicus]
MGDDTEGTRNDGNGKGGGIVIGRISGGAVASGEKARAEDRSERVGAPAAPDAGAGPVPVPSGAPGAGGIAVGEMLGGALAAGPEAEAVDSSRELLALPPELLTAVRELRGQLPLLARSEDDGLDDVDGELAGLEATAVRDGRAERGRLVRLRALLTGGATAAGGLASALSVVQAITQLLA